MFIVFSRKGRYFRLFYSNVGKHGAIWVYGVRTPYVTSCIKILISYKMVRFTTSFIFFAFNGQFPFQQFKVKEALFRLAKNFMTEQTLTE